MTVLVCGGAGYIGSHAVAQLLDRNEKAVVVDNLQNGHEEAILDEVTFLTVICVIHHFSIACFKKTKFTQSYTLQQTRLSERV